MNNVFRKEQSFRYFFFECAVLCGVLRLYVYIDYDMIKLIRY